jgi:hypothetical protein
MSPSPRSKPRQWQFLTTCTFKRSSPTLSVQWKLRKDQRWAALHQHSELSKKSANPFSSLLVLAA